MNLNCWEIDEILENDKVAQVSTKAIDSVDCDSLGTCMAMDSHCDYDCDMS